MRRPLRILLAVLVLYLLPAHADNNILMNERVTLGGGCFWCIEAIFERCDGVKTVISGYAGGRTEFPTYEEVCAGKSGHAEVVQVEFDPGKTSVDKLLELFWKAHDPTTLDRQGADVGTQYRSVIFYKDEEQRQIAESSKKKTAAKFDQPIVTEILPLKEFYPAEDYHQDYFARNQRAPYCTQVIRPKLEKLQSKGAVSP